MKQSIEITKPETVGNVEFSRITFLFDKVQAEMKTVFDTKDYVGVSNLIDTYNEMTEEGKPFAIEYIKRIVVNCFNNAQGTTFTWDQVPDSIFV